MFRVKYASILLMFLVCVASGTICFAQMGNFPSFPGYRHTQSTISPHSFGTAAVGFAAGYMADKMTDGAFSEMERRPRFSGFLANKEYFDCALEKFGSQIIQEADLALTDIELQMSTFGSKRNDYFAQREGLAERLGVTTFPSKLQECHKNYQERMQKSAKQDSAQGFNSFSFGQPQSFDEYMKEKYPKAMTTEETAKTFKDLNMSPAPWTEEYKSRVR